MRKFLCCYFLMCFLVNSKAQNHLTDSLKDLLNIEHRDTVRANILNQLSFLYVNRNADTSLIYAKQAMTLATASHNALLESASLNNIALVFQQIGDNVKALDFLLQSLKKAESINDRKRMSSAMANIGSTYRLLGDNRTCLEYTHKARKIFEELHDERRTAACLLNIGDTYEKLDMLDSARIFATMANDMANKISHKGLIGLSMGNLGNIYTKMGQTAIAMSYYRSAIPILTEAGNEAGICEYSLGIAKLFEKTGQQDSALYYGKLVFQVAQKGSFLFDQLQASKFISSIYKKIPAVDSAYRYMEIMIALKDSIFSEEKTRQFQSLHLNETLRQEKITSEKLEAALERKQRIKYAFIALAIISFAGIFFLISRSVIVTEKLIKFLGILGLLMVFEFINLVLHPFISYITGHSPIFMLLIMVAIAALLIPLHHKMEHFIIHRMTTKNRLLRLNAARKIVAELEAEVAEKPEIKE